MLVLVLQQILSLLGLLGQNIILLCHYTEQKRILDNSIRHIILDPPRRVTRRATRRSFWVIPCRTSSWWDNFVNGVVVDDKWRDNFCMSRASLVSLSEELCPYIEGQTTVMRAPIDTCKRVAMTLYYLTTKGCCGRLLMYLACRDRLCPSLSGRPVKRSLSISVQNTLSFPLRSWRPRIWF